MQLCIPASLVPQPVVAVTADNTGTLYAGTSFTLTCTVILDSSVDNSERIVMIFGPYQIIDTQSLMPLENLLVSILAVSQSVL